MQAGAEGGFATSASRSRTIAVLALIALGYALTLYVFFPGVMTLDARYVYNDMLKYNLGDWQSPVMLVLWLVIDPIAPGSRSMFLLIVTLYWLAFALIAVGVARRSWLALALPVLAITPPAFVLVGIIWRDVLFASTWLLAAALVFIAGDNTKLRRWMQVVALLLLVLGVLLRPNAVPAAPILMGYIFWPLRWSFKRMLLLYVPAFLVFVALIPTVYYGILGAKRQHPLHQIFVYDLGGISHFTKENQFPVVWSAEETALLLESCYAPDKWDVYWYMEPCKFVMSRLEADKIFGEPALPDAWRRAVFKHPIVYLRHRATFMAAFLTGTNLVMWTQDIENPTKNVFADRAVFTWFLNLQETLRPTWMFKQATWLLLCVVLCMLALRRRETSEGAFVIGTCGSAAAFSATYFFFGVASDYRYTYFAVLAVLCSVVVMLPRLFARRNRALSEIA